MSDHSSSSELPISNKLKKIKNNNNVLKGLQKLFGYFKFSKKKNKDIDEFDKTIEEIKHVSSSLTNEEKEIFNNFLMFGSKIVSKVMVPRSDICAIPSNATNEDLIKTVLENGHTRTLIFEDSLDNIIGFVHIKDLFKAIANKNKSHFKKLMRKHIIAAPSMKLVDLLAEMQKKKTHIAVVLDEYGGTDGIVTIEDLLEGIVGKIEDEHDSDTNDLENYKLINPKTILCNARVNVEEVENILKIKLRRNEEDFETIGGLILARAGYFPKSGAKLRISDNIFAEILESSARNIKTLKLMIK